MYIFLGNMNLRSFFKITAVSFALFLCSTILFTPEVSAQKTQTTTGESVKEKYEQQSKAFRGKEGAQVGEETQDPRVVVAMIIRWALGLVGIVALGYTVYGGYLILTSRGNEEKLEDGKSTLLTATIGILVILASYGITNFVMDSLYRGTKPACDPDKPFCTKIKLEQEPEGRIKKQPTDLPPRQEKKETTWGWSY
ncbi:MAG: pilin [Candidatus Paceibacteria bacterium]